MKDKITHKKYTSHLENQVENFAKASKPSKPFMAEWSSVTYAVFV